LDCCQDAKSSPVKSRAKRRRLAVPLAPIDVNSSSQSSEQSQSSESSASPDSSASYAPRAAASRKRKAGADPDDAPAAAKKPRQLPAAAPKKPASAKSAAAPAKPKAKAKAKPKAKSAKSAAAAAAAAAEKKAKNAKAVDDNLKRAKLTALRKSLGQLAVRKRGRPAKNSDVPAVNFMQDVINIWSKAIESPPDSDCVSCQWSSFKGSGRFTQRKVRDLKAIASLLPEGADAESTVPVCRRCWKSIKAKEMPKFCLLNGLHIDELPPALDKLDKYEKRLVAPVQIYQELFSLPVGQPASKGIAIMFPHDVPKVLNQLPARADESGVALVRTAAKRAAPPADVKAAADRKDDGKAAAEVDGEDDAKSDVKAQVCACFWLSVLVRLLTRFGLCVFFAGWSRSYLPRAQRRGARGCSRALRDPSWLREHQAPRRGRGPAR
jgi:hypothetical protein